MNERLASRGEGALKCAWVGAKKSPVSVRLRVAHRRVGRSPDVQPAEPDASVLEVVRLRPGWGGGSNLCAHVSIVKSA
eukprot:6194280-Pleurochrysis_carterae.AAC.1